MKKTFLTASLALFFASTGLQAFDDYCCPPPVDCCYQPSTIYAKFLAGANFAQTTKVHGNRLSVNPGFLVSGAVGYKWDESFSLEAEYAYRRNDLKNLHIGRQTLRSHGHIQSSAYMGNVFYNLPWDCFQLSPYIGAGVGYSDQKITASNDGLSFNDHIKGFAWQAMVGVRFPLHCNIDLEVEYRLHKGRAKDLYNHAACAALVYNFN